MFVILLESKQNPKKMTPIIRGFLSKDGNRLVADVKNARKYKTELKAEMKRKEFVGSGFNSEVLPI